MSASLPVRKPGDEDQDSDFSAVHSIETYISPSLSGAVQMAQDRNQRDARDCNNGKSVLGIGVEFGEGNATMHSHRRESGPISFANSAWSATIIITPAEFSTLEKHRISPAAARII